MSTAFYGGTFDPFHNGHLALVRTLIERSYCGEVLVVPAARSPLKKGHEASPEDRLEMARLALRGMPAVRVLDMEIRRPEPSYTVDSLEALVAADPDEPLRLVIGDDALATFPSWHRQERILELSELLVFARRGAPPAPAAMTGLHQRVRDFDMPVSATEVRRELSAGRLPRDMVPGAVLDYIVERGLYGVSSAGR